MIILASMHDALHGWLVMAGDTNKNKQVVLATASS